MKTRSEKFLRQRKFLMVLPLITFPFITLLFWALGGGQGSPAQAETVEYTGLNLNLPDAHFNEEETLNKLRLYEIAARDSAKFQRAKNSDPYFTLSALQETPSKDEPYGTEAKESNLNTSLGLESREDPNEAKVNRKLEQLQKVINAPVQQHPAKAQQPVAPAGTGTSEVFSNDVDRLENMMEMFNTPAEADPEMQQLETMLDKILEIQHPELMREKIQALSKQNQGAVFPVEAKPGNDPISLFTSNTETTQPSSPENIHHVSAVAPVQNGFYGLYDDFNSIEEPNAVQAVIHDTQELVSGATVKLRLTSDIYINGALIPSGEFIYGTCAISGERLTIKISSIRFSNSLYPVALTVFDLDGLEGIYTPGLISRDAAKQSSNDALQNIQMMSLDPSIGAQAAGAGIEAAKGLFSKKSRLIKVTVKAGYQVLLKDANAKAI